VARTSGAADCNRNGVDDLDDMVSGASADCNHNGVPDDCDVLPPASFDAVECRVGAGAAAQLADFDADADLDVVLLGDSIAISRNLGAGEFSRPTPFVAGRGARSMAAGDLDVDGYEDLAVALQSGPSVAILRNRGAASFESPIEISTGTGPNGIALTDLNRDGRLDIVTAGTAGLSVMVGTGPLEFGGATLHAGAGFASSIAISDLYGDGDPDIVQCSPELDHISVIRNEAGMLSEAVHIPARQGLSQLVAIDLNGDGVPDIAAAADEIGPELLVVRGLPAGSTSTIERVPLDYLGRFIVAFDPDHDGDVDLALAHSRQAHFHPNVTVLFQEGDGSFAGGAKVPVQGGTASRSLAAGDLDGDAFPELVTASESFVVFWNGKRPLFGTTLAIRTDRDPRQMLAGDFDLDGVPEALVYTGGRGWLHAFEVTQRSWSVRTAAVDVGYPGPLAKHDVDADGDPDVIHARGNLISFWDNDGLGSFTRNQTIFVPVNEMSAFDLTDIDADGAQDFVFLEGTNLHLIRSPGGQEIVPPLFLGGAPTAVETADLNGDGRLDVVACDPISNKIHLLWQREGIQLTGMPPLVAGVAPASLVLVDLDRDGDVDIAAANGGSDDVSIFSNDGAGGFPPAYSIAAGAGPASITVGDVNGDGRPDLATCNPRSDSVSVLLNDVSGLHRAAELPVAEDPLGIVAGDLDQDGKDDLAVSSFTSGTLHLLLSSSGQAFEKDCNANRSPDSCDIAAGLAEDLDSDGVPDGCESRPFRRGDPNDDGASDLSDAVLLLVHLFGGAPSPGCMDSADANADLDVDIGDAVYVLDWLFRGGSPPPPPGAAFRREPCGTVAGDAGLGCDEYRSCAWAF